MSVAAVTARAPGLGSSRLAFLFANDLPRRSGKQRRGVIVLFRFNGVTLGLGWSYSVNIGANKYVSLHTERICGKCTLGMREGVPNQFNSLTF